MLKGVIEAERAERDQEADCARINAAIGLAEQDIAALESRQLEPDEMREKWSAIATGQFSPFAQCATMLLNGKLRQNKPRGG